MNMNPSKNGPEFQSLLQLLLKKDLQNFLRRCVALSLLGTGSFKVRRTREDVSCLFEGEPIALMGNK